MRDNDFDRLIQDILKGIQVPYMPGHWSMLSEKLDSWQVPEDAEFDMDVAEGLESIQPPYQPAHWEVLATRLDVLGNDPNMEFDEQVGEQLNSLQPEYQPAHWEAMSEAMDAFDQLTDEAFDNKIADTLVQFQPPYQPEYWQMMMDKQEEHRRKMVRFITLRSAELLLLLLLWLSWPLFPTERTPGDLDKETERIQLPEVASDDNIHTNPSTDQAGSGSTGSESNNVPLSGMASSGSEQPANGGVVVAHSPQVTPQLLQDLKIMAPEASDSGHPITSRVERASDPRGTENASVSSPENAGDGTTTGMDGIVEHIVLANEAGDLFGDRNVMSSLPGLNGTEMAVTGPENKSFEGLSTVPDIAETVRRKRISLSPYISADFNAIRSFPNIQELDETSLEHLTLTPGAGLGIGFHNGPWSVHSGVGYAYRFYDPNITEQFGSINGYVELNFNKVAFHMLQLPIRMHYNVVEGMKYNFYIAAGASLHYIVRQEFEKPKNYSSSFDINLATMRPQLESEQYRSGNFLTKFNEATYVTADIGFGLERKLNEDLILYIQPTYMRMFGAGVGPNFDVIHTLSLQLGLRI